MQKKVKQYGICTAHTNEELATQVCALLQEGWELHGFVYQSAQPTGNFFHQAMVSFKPPMKIKRTVDQQLGVTLVEDANSKPKKRHHKQQQERA
ncbi:MAG: DUF1737 domain-containing protein [Ferruginibacter sp.]